MVDLHLKCLILAAGQSTRFGSAKPLAQLANGKTMLAQVIDLYSSVFTEVAVVANDDIAQSITQRSATYIECAQAHLGLSQSLIAGVKSLQPAESIMVALGDMPYVSKKTLYLLKEQASSHAIVAPEYQGQRGNPIVIGNAFFSELYALRGDVGAKSILQRQADHLRLISVDDFGVCYDVDTPDRILR